VLGVTVIGTPLTGYYGILPPMRIQNCEGNAQHMTGTTITITITITQHIVRKLVTIFQILLYSSLSSLVC